MQPSHSPLIHTRRLSWGVNKQTHPSSPCLPVGHSRVEESLASRGDGPPGTLRRVMSPGIAPGWDPQCHVPRFCGPYEGVLNRSLSEPSPRACLPWETQPGAFKPQTT
ncbi:hypothetical protein AMECASPLE_037761 [Ameca splendens]|uniref:Uncharacterized protein n=1 Tax=Ameca splendens TaxID=208324 RepID=A0ABV0YV40_9TELE